MTNPSPIAADEAAPAPSQRLTPRALLELKRLSDPQINSDGQRIAFTVYEADFEDSRWVSHIWITEYLSPDSEAESDSSEDDDKAAPESGLCEPEEPEAASPDDLTRQLTFSTEGETDPLWSPDGSALAFLSSRPDTTQAQPTDDEDEPSVSQIWALPMEGGEARRVTNSKEPILDFCWTPDGLNLIYLTLEARPRPIESVFRDRVQRKSDPIVEHDDDRRRQFWSVAVEDRKPHLLFTADYGVESFALSPDGGKIAYLTNYTGDDNDYHIADLYLRDLAGGVTVKLARREGGKYRLRWSPSGSLLAFLSWHDPHLSYSRETVYTVEIPTAEAMAEFARNASLPSNAYSATRRDIRSARVQIEAPGIADCRPISNLDSDVTSFEWLDDEFGIFALAAVGTSTQLFNLLPESLAAAAEAGDSVPVDPLTQAGPDRRDLAVHRESGCAVWVEESNSGPPEIVLRKPDGEEVSLTKLNSHFAETYRVPGQEVVAWSAPDGQRIEGVVTYPLDYQPGSSYPMVVQVHGGPKGRATDALLDYPMPSVWASEGYLVLRPNYRGSEGYGHDFAVANRRDLGGADYEDVMAGVDWAVDRGLADPNRIGILGGSYGGYMVNWAIGHTDRFKAGISMFGIFHLQTDYSNSRLSRWEHDYAGAYYWEDPEIYHKMSPASYLAEMRTPTLIIHGDEDDNTSISNSREIYRALLQRGVPTQFVHYPREGHGIQEPNHRLDELRRSLAWMDRYVRGDGEKQTLYRLGDRIPHSDGRLELCVLSADTATFIGERDPKNGAGSSLLEVVFTLHSVDPTWENEPVIFSLRDVHLSDGASAEPLMMPIGVPLDLPGGKILVTGEDLRISQTPDPETGEFAFAAAAVFRVPKRGNRMLQIADFAPVAVSWSDDEEDTPNDDQATLLEHRMDHR